MKSNGVRIGLVGCGAIGSRLALLVQRDYPNRARITALHDISHSHARALQRRLHPPPPIVSLPTLIRKSHLVLEAASVEIAGDVVRRALQARRDVFVMSVGALLKDQRWRRLAERVGRKVYIPSGALAGLDGVAAMSVGRIRRISLITRKPPRALADAPLIRRKKLNLTRLTRPTVVFEGSPEAAVRAFPQNTNVAAVLALAAGGAAVHRGSRGVPGAKATGSRVAMRVRVVADPTIRRNVHELEVEGDCGRVRCQVESRPSANPKTSELAVRSAVATLGRIFDAVVVGT